MENSKKEMESVQRTNNASNQSTTGANTIERSVDKLQPSNLLNDRCETNALVEHRHHHHRHYEILDLGKSENLSTSDFQLKETTLDDLNEYCLLEIFSYLSYDDMIKVKRVSKNFYDMSQRVLKKALRLTCWVRDSGLFAFMIYEKYSKRRIYDKNEISNFNDLIPVLQSYADHIKFYEVEIVFDYRSYFSRRGESDEKKFFQRLITYEECEKFLFQVVPKFCKNIINFTLDIVTGEVYDILSYGTSSYFKTMATHWRKLEDLKISPLYYQYNENFSQLLRNNKKLKTLDLWFDDEYKLLLNDKLFSCLPSTIQEIKLEKLSNDDNTQWSHFISASHNFTSLQSLEIKLLDYLTDAAIAAIANIKSLTHLGLLHVDRFESHKIPDTIANMKSLKSLELVAVNDLNEDSFINIVESCIQLEQLDVRYVTWLTDNGMTAIAKLKKLKRLVIDAEHVTTESIMSLCGNLEILWCYRSKINNVEAIELLKKATNLKYMKFIYCRNLNEDIILAANEIANQRMTNRLRINTSCCGFLAKRMNTPYFTYSENSAEISLKTFMKDVTNHDERFLL